MSALAMRYGSVEDGRPATAGLQRVYAGSISDGSTVIIDFEPGGMYLLFVSEYRVSNGSFRGQRIFSIKAPEIEEFGASTINRGTVYSSSESGVTLTNNNDSTLSIAQASSTYAVRYALYKAF